MQICFVRAFVFDCLSIYVHACSFVFLHPNEVKTIFQDLSQSRVPCVHVFIFFPACGSKDKNEGVNDYVKL